MAENAALSWKAHWTVVGEKIGEGGQAQVYKVQNELGDFGALKLLKDDQIKRRARMRCEVDALTVLEGKGVPWILASNAAGPDWADKSVELYVVMEWIDGKTLERICSGKPLNVDLALEYIDAILATIESCHALQVHHRDLHPRNVIVRSLDNRPVLIDFGMAWRSPDEDRETFNTDIVEPGNRFLRLPEHAADKHREDARSDVTFAVGLLFYLITGVDPRVLRDADDRMPHEALANCIPEEVKSDTRWPRLRSVFAAGFQHSLEMRHQSASELRKQLRELEQIPA